MKVLDAITAFCLAFVEWVRWQRETEIDRLEDELDDETRAHTLHPSADRELRVRRLEDRLKRKKRQIGLE